ncbi:hypothetical protein CTAYLR_006165 [Chrysophaeum taylorii]|uniref:3'-5' exonuclease domain-containing protein n=1 Tax=Chrysophaeum taylorii TaxID=2483200 RepID=A0AAD7UNK8_9STRA|nr:hypothetical protein CTAYLR_006165 [Chrysophaeum taylorii]
MVAAFGVWGQVAVAAARGIDEETVARAALGLRSVAGAVRELRGGGPLPPDHESKNECTMLASGAAVAMGELELARGAGWPRLREITLEAWRLEGAAASVAAATCVAGAARPELREAASVVSQLAQPEAGIGARALAAGLAHGADLRCAAMLAKQLPAAAALDDELSVVARSAFGRSTPETLSAASALVAHLKPWTPEFRATEVVERCVARDLWDLAADVAVDDRDAAEVLVARAMAARRFRQADAYATRLLGGAVPARLAHARSTITKLCAKRQYALVERVVSGVDSLDDSIASEAARDHAITELRRHDPWLARRLSRLWGRDDDVEEVERTEYLRWTDAFSRDDVPELVGDPAAVAPAIAELRGVVGFDTEWGADGRPAVLQFASEDAAVILDLVSLGASEKGRAALRDHVAPLFYLDHRSLDDVLVVVGFAVHHDLRRLSTLFPPTDKPATAVLDVQRLVVRAHPAHPVLGRTKTPPGLATVAAHLLGKPLDKAEQCSAWDRRPLSLPQRTYAVLDAWACVAIYTRLCENKNPPPFSSSSSIIGS